LFLFAVVDRFSSLVDACFIFSLFIWMFVSKDYCAFCEKIV
jgi:hypothetical protein